MNIDINNMVVNESDLDSIRATAKRLKCDELPPFKLRYLYFRLLPPSIFPRDNRSVYRPSNNQLIALLDLTSSQVSALRFDPELNKILVYMQFYKVSDIVPLFINELKEGIRKHRATEMYIMKGIMTDMFALISKQPSNHLHLHLPKKEVDHILENLKNHISKTKSYDQVKGKKNYLTDGIINNLSTSIDKIKEINNIGRVEEEAPRVP